jgi:hypothetical protein
MAETYSDLLARAERYAAQHNLSVDFSHPLGHGTDGAVWRAGDFAIKVFFGEKQYAVELACYERLEQRGIDSIGAFDVPILLGQDDELLVIQISFVTPPFVLDFGKSYLDRPPPAMSAEMLAYIDQEQRELWETRERYRQVQSILWQLRQIGIYYQDPKPGNIDFGDS